MQIRTAADFNLALAEATNGDKVTYHTGDLRSDRKRFAAIREIGAAAWKAYENGHCTLVQRRLELGRYEYIAIKIMPPRPVKFVGCYEPQWEPSRKRKPAAEALAA